MRLHPPVTQAEALAWLRSQAEPLSPNARPEELQTVLQPLAEAMAAISATVLPDDLEPLFP